MLALPGVPDAATLGQLGVGRISVGSAFAWVALGALAQAGRELLDEGTYGFWELAGVGAAAAKPAFMPPT